MPKYDPTPIPVWVEITKTTHSHGGEGWELGKCLWSPTEDRRGADRYATMRMVSPGDRVLHTAQGVWEDRGQDTLLFAWSRAADTAEVIEREPPEPGRWEGFDSYYRIPLTDFERFDSPLSIPDFMETYRNEILWEIERGVPTHYPFGTYGDGVRTVQGQYLGRCTAHIHDLFLEALEINEAVESEAGADEEPQRGYAEGRRRLREQQSFSRNPKLVRDAKEHYEYTCQGCGFHFGEFYGKIGEGYIECHHLTPLSKQKGEFTSNLHDVSVLCANCHRVIHRQDPPLEPSTLRKITGFEP